MTPSIVSYSIIGSPFRLVKDDKNRKKHQKNDKKTTSGEVALIPRGIGFP